MSTDMAREQAIGTAQRLRDYLAGTDQDSIDLYREETDNEDDAYEISASNWCGDGILDVKRTYSSSRELDSVELLVGFGGPNIWATFNGRGCEIKVTWYCEPVYEWVDCPEFSTEMLELFDDWEVK